MQSPSRTTRRCTTATVLAVAAAAQLACNRPEQRAAGSGGQEPRGSATSESAAVELTGCMERGPIPGSFVLTGVSPAGASAEEPTGTAGHDAATGGSFTVRAENASDLGRYVGRRVSVSGHFTVLGDQSNTGAAGSSASATQPGVDAAPGTPGVPGSRASAPGTTGSGAAARDADSTAATAGPSAVPTRLLTATAVKEIGSSCTAASER